MDALREPIDSYDYIVCGGGTSGCVVAGRLAENPNAKILLLEAGQHNKDLENVHMVGGWSNMFDSETDWNITTPPMGGVNDRQVKLSRGRFLGGCSGCNGTLCIRGCKQDFDDWNLEGWSGDEVFACMRKAETFHPKPWFQDSPKDHGYSGPLHTEPHDPAPISQLMLASFISAGMPLVPDMFSSGDTAHGCGHVPRTVYEGLRTTSADFVTNGFSRKNVTIMTGCTVDKVLVEGADSGDLRATGVVVYSFNAAKPQVYHARKEVVISGGAYCSPAILLRSGIGPATELRNHSIPPVLELSGVGQNLMDHPIVFIFYSTSHPNITTDYKAYHGNALEASYNLWKTEKKGFLSTFPFGVFAYARMDERLAKEPIWQKYLQENNNNNNNSKKEGKEPRDPMGLHPTKQPTIELFNTECYGGPKQYADFPSAPTQNAFSIIVELFSPRSRGSVTLAGRDPRANPVVDAAFLQHELDLLVLSEGCRFADEIVMEGAGTKDVVRGSWPEGLGYGEKGTLRSREEWVPYVKDHATTCYHAAGTCAMGNDNDPNAVLDNKLRVRGISNLRVADCSVMPTLHSGHTQMAAYGIGEKCAELIKEQWKQEGVNQDLRAVL